MLDNLEKSNLLGKLIKYANDDVYCRHNVPSEHRRHANAPYIMQIR